jgi:hypothetical protein
MTQGHRNRAAGRFGSFYVRGTDFVITVGTSNPRDTQDPAHRQRLVSQVDVAPNIIVNTEELVDPDAWTRAQETHPDRWKLSIPDDVLLNREFTRVIDNILGSVERAGRERGGLFPERRSLNFSDLFRLFSDIWCNQQGRCGLCKGPIDDQPPAIFELKPHLQAAG